MQALLFSVLLSVSSLLVAEQGVYIPPRNKKAAPTIVSMSIGDNIVPLVEIGPNGPTLVKFPGKVVTIVIDNKAYTWKELAPTKNDRGQVFSYVSFSESSKLTKPQKDFLGKNAVSIVAIYIYEGKEYVHDIDLVRRPDKRRSYVALIPMSKGLPVRAEMLKSFEKKFHVIDRTIDKNKKVCRVKGNSEDKLELFKDSGFKVEGKL